MAKKHLEIPDFEPVSFKKQVGFGEKEFVVLAKDAKAAGFSSVNEYIRYLCRTHAERPYNRGKKS